MAKRKLVLRNNKIVPGRRYEGLTEAAEKIVVDSIGSMFNKLAKLQHVEIFEDDGEYTTCTLNGDTAFREELYDIVEQEVSGQFRNY